MNRRAAFSAGAMLALLVVGFAAGAYADQQFPDWIPYVGHHSSGRIDLSEVEQAARLISADYVDPNVNTTKLSQSSVQGLISGLNPSPPTSPPTSTRSCRRAIRATIRESGST